MVRDVGNEAADHLALTKSDLVPSETGQVENIFDRILRQSEENVHWQEFGRLCGSRQP